MSECQKGMSYAMHHRYALHTAGYLSPSDLAWATERFSNSGRGLAEILERIQDMVCYRKDRVITTLNCLILSAEIEIPNHRSYIRRVPIIDNSANNEEHTYSANESCKHRCIPHRLKQGQCHCEYSCQKSQRQNCRYPVPVDNPWCQDLSCAFKVKMLSAQRTFR